VTLYVQVQLLDGAEWSAAADVAGERGSTLVHHRVYLQRHTVAVGEGAEETLELAGGEELFQMLLIVLPDLRACPPYEPTPLPATVCTVYNSTHSIQQYAQYTTVRTVYNSTHSIQQHTQYAQYTTARTVYNNTHSIQQHAQYTTVRTVYNSTHSIQQYAQYTTHSHNNKSYIRDKL